MRTLERPALTSSDYSWGSIDMQSELAGHKSKADPGGVKISAVITNLQVANSWRS